MINVINPIGRDSRLFKGLYGFIAKSFPGFREVIALVLLDRG